MSLLLQILFFPLDLLFLTWDAVRISLDRFTYASVRPEGDQPCIHCKNEDCGYRPRRLPGGLKKYRNRSVGCFLQSCTRSDPSRKRGQRHVCVQDGGFIKYPAWVPLLCILLLLFWGLLIYGAFRLLDF